VTGGTARRLPLALLVLLVPGLVLAQGLGDAAARERQKREASGGREKGRVFTNDDLPKPDASGASTPEAAPEAAAQASEESRPRSPDDRGTAEDPVKAALDQAQTRVDEARAAVVAGEERVKELSDKLNPMSPSFIYGGTGQGNMAAEEARTREELRQAEAQLADARAELVKATQAQENLRLRRTPSPE
jgi:hypothetical protein